MTDTHPASDSSATHSAPSLGMMAVVAVGLAAAVVARARSTAPSANGPAALITYLREHLSGSDAAYQVVEKLRRTSHGGEELFDRLLREFEEERDVVRGILEALDASSSSLKRLAAQASAPLLRASAGGAPGELSLFRTLEGLAVGVQGKRCLWRALQALESRLTVPGRRSFSDLEAQAVRQWESIEQRRLTLVTQTFSGPPTLNVADTIR